MARPKPAAPRRIQTTMRIEAPLLKELSDIAQRERDKYRSRSHLIEAQMWDFVKKYRTGRPKKAVADVLG